MNDTPYRNHKPKTRKRPLPTMHHGAVMSAGCGRALTIRPSPKAGLPVEFKEASMTQIPAADASVDLVISVLV